MEPLGENEVNSKGASDRDAIRHYISRYFALFKRFWWIFLITTLATTSIVYFHTKSQPAVYSATTKIIFRESNPNAFGKKLERLQFVDPGGRWKFDQFWATQKEVFKARWFIKSVVADEGLMELESFSSAIIADAANERERLAINKVLSMVEISLQPGSRVALIKVSSNDAGLSSQLANGIATAYVSHMRELQSGGLTKMSKYFNSEVQSTRAQLDKAQTALRDFERTNKILTMPYRKQQELTTSNIESTTRQINDVQDRLDAEESLLNQINEMFKKKEDPKTIAQMVNSANLSVGIQREDVLEQTLAELESIYGPSYEKVKGVQDQLNVVRKNISDEINRIRAGIRNRVGKLKRERGAKRTRLKELKQEVENLDQLGKSYFEIKDRVQSMKDFYKLVLDRAKELDINSNFEDTNQSSTIDILQRAELPRQPVNPGLLIKLILGILLGLFLGTAIILGIDAADNTVKLESDVERLTTKPILGHLPQVDSSLLDQFGSIDTMVDIAPKSSFAEGVRTLRTNLMFMSPDNPPRCILVTSPGPGEGKTLTSTNMGIAMAKSGLKTLIIDGDMRRPRLHKALSVENTEGLSDILSATHEIDDVLQETNIENLSVISCGTIPPNPSELLHTPRFKALMKELSGRFDRLIVDSPPLGAVSDGLVLSTSADAVLLILKFGKTRRDLLRRSINQLEGIGAPFMGCVLNDISSSAGSYLYSYYNYREKYEQDVPPARLVS